MQPPSYLIGVDGGGTGTRAVVALADGRVVGQGRGGPSALGQGVAKAWVQVQAAIHQAFGEAGLGAPDFSTCALSCGLSGASYTPWRDTFIATNPGFGKLIVETDAFAMLLGAHDAEPGAIVAAGTGSVGEALHPDGRRLRASGWGFPVGDEGSGAWLGLKAMRHAQCVMDGRALPGSLASRIFALCGEDRTTLLDWCNRSTQYGYAQLAPLVFDEECRDGTAARLVTEAVTALADIAGAIDPGATLPVCFTGSIGERLAPRLPAALRERIRPPRYDAATGALAWLKRDLHSTAVTAP
ncbi:MAG: BadF/BadG/BcrA/BcrD ATPase family protein [Burkholderiales bacterium]|nr:BadF/BadG/BcrA/BcrD ATPase family protein [Burkholderiales bacterium]